MPQTLNFARRAIGAAALYSAALFGAPTLAADDLKAILENFDRVQGSILSLQAEFTETIRSPLLKEPMTARGRFFMTKPDSIRWEYSSPEPMRFVIAANEYTGYFPDQQRAERRNIRRWREQMFKFLGVGQASHELAEFYEIRLVPSDEAGVVVLGLDPKKRRVRKRLDEVQMWIDRSSYLPVRIEYGSQKGTTRTLRFEAMQVNPELQASLFRVDIPPGIKITEGFSALSGFGEHSRP
jgi:outer membrane lipoprotein-sorting protein